jgi:hypothetical protein
VPSLKHEYQHVKHMTKLISSETLGPR